MSERVTMAKRDVEWLVRTNMLLGFFIGLATGIVVGLLIP